MDEGKTSSLEAPSRKFVIVASTDANNQGDSEELKTDDIAPLLNVDSSSSVKSLGSFRLHFRTENTVKEKVPKAVTFRQSVYEIQEEHFAFDGGKYHIIYSHVSKNLFNIHD